MEIYHEQSVRVLK